MFYQNGSWRDPDAKAMLSYQSHPFPRQEKSAIYCAYMHTCIPELNKHKNYLRRPHPPNTLPTLLFQALGAC